MASRLLLGFLVVLTTALISTNAQSTAAPGTLGGSCATQSCNGDYICSNNTCGLKAGADCTNNPKSCVTGSTCKANQCSCDDNLIPYWDGSCVPFVTLGGACSRFDVCHNQPDASLKLACVSNKCLIQVNQSCAGNTDKCVTGATCNSGLCQCEQGFFDWDKDGENKCRRHATIGTDCSDGASCQDVPNGPEITCDPYKLTCVIKEDKACNSSTQMFCPTGAACQNLVCTCVPPYHHDKGGCRKMIGTVGGVCGPDDLCKNDSLPFSMDCDRLSGKCLLKVGETCQNYRDNCLTGSVCSNATNTCVCSGDYTTSDSRKSCQGPRGQVGGQCTGNACSDTSSTCDDGYCVCKSGYTFIDANSTCVSGGGNSGGGDNGGGGNGGNTGGTASSVATGILSLAVFLLCNLLRG